MEGIRVEGANMIVVARVNINLSALTIDQVVSKRRKVVTEMCQSMTEELKSELRGDAWQDLRKAFQNVKLPFGPDGKSEHRGDQVVAYIPEQLEKVRAGGEACTHYFGHYSDTCPCCMRADFVACS